MDSVCTSLLWFEENEEPAGELLRNIDPYCITGIKSKFKLFRLFGAAASSGVSFAFESSCVVHEHFDHTNFMQLLNEFILLFYSDFESKLILDNL